MPGKAPKVGKTEKQEEEINWPSENFPKNVKQIVIATFLPSLKKLDILNSKDFKNWIAVEIGKYLNRQYQGWITSEDFRGDWYLLLQDYCIKYAELEKKEVVFSHNIINLLLTAGHTELAQECSTKLIELRDRIFKQLDVNLFEEALTDWFGSDKELWEQKKKEIENKPDVVGFLFEYHHRVRKLSAKEQEAIQNAGEPLKVNFKDRSGQEFKLSSGGEYEVYRLTRPEHLKEEGSKLNHCIGDDNRNYKKDILEVLPNGESKAYSFSLRKNGESIFTIWYDTQSKKITDIKGLKNRYLTKLDDPETIAVLNLLCFLKNKFANVDVDGQNIDTNIELESISDLSRILDKNTFLEKLDVPDEQGRYFKVISLKEMKKVTDDSKIFYGVFELSQGIKVLHILEVLKHKKIKFVFDETFILNSNLDELLEAIIESGRRDVAIEFFTTLILNSDPSGHWYSNRNGKNAEIFYKATLAKKLIAFADSDGKLTVKLLERLKHHGENHSELIFFLFERLIDFDDDQLYLALSDLDEILDTRTDDEKNRKHSKYKPYKFKSQLEDLVDGIEKKIGKKFKIDIYKKYLELLGSDENKLKSLWGKLYKCGVLFSYKLNQSPLVHKILEVDVDKLDEKSTKELIDLGSSTSSFEVRAFLGEKKYAEFQQKFLSSLKKASVEFPTENEKTKDSYHYENIIAFLRYISDEDYKIWDDKIKKEISAILIKDFRYFTDDERFTYPYSTAEISEIMSRCLVLDDLEKYYVMMYEVIKSDEQIEPQLEDWNGWGNYLKITIDRLLEEGTDTQIESFYQNILIKRNFFLMLSSQGLGKIVSRLKGISNKG